MINKGAGVSPRPDSPCPRLFTPPPCSMLAEVLDRLRLLASVVRAGGVSASSPPSLAGRTPHASCDGGAAVVPSGSPSLASGSVEDEQNLRGCEAPPAAACPMMSRFLAADGSSPPPALPSLTGEQGVVCWRFGGRRETLGGRGKEWLSLIRCPEQSNRNRLFGWRQPLQQLPHPAQHGVELSRGGNALAQRCCCREACRHSLALMVSVELLLAHTTRRLVPHASQQKPAQPLNDCKVCPPVSLFFDVRLISSTP